MKSRRLKNRGGIMEKDSLYEEILESFKNNKGKFFGAFLGFLAGILFLTIGFFKTILLILCTVIGLYFGSSWDIEKDIRKIINKILPPKLR